MNMNIKEQFQGELRTFFIISLMNLVFAALAIAFGVGIIVQQATPIVEGLKAGILPPLPSVMLIMLVLAAASFLLGLKWVTFSAKVFHGVQKIKKASDAQANHATDEEVTGLIIRMINHYREHKKIIEQMTLVCTLGGCCFLALGVMNSLEFFTTGPTSGTFTLDLHNYLLIPSALITLGMGLISLLNSFSFWKFSKVWDRRLEEIASSEGQLIRSMEQYIP